MVEGGVAYVTVAAVAAAAGVSRERVDELIRHGRLVPDAIATTGGTGRQVRLFSRETLARFLAQRAATPGTKSAPSPVP